MLKQYLPGRNPVGWVVGLVLIGLILAACGGAAGSISNEAPSPAGAEKTAATAAPVEEMAEEKTAKEEAVAEAQPTEEVAQSENSLEPNKITSQAWCEPVEVPNNELIAAVSDSDWVKGPANAPVTLIEYGDFQ